MWSKTPEWNAHTTSQINTNIVVVVAAAVVRMKHAITVRSGNEKRKRSVSCSRCVESTARTTWGWLKNYMREQYAFQYTLWYVREYYYMSLWTLSLFKCHRAIQKKGFFSLSALSLPVWEKMYLCFDVTAAIWHIYLLPCMDDDASTTKSSFELEKNIMCAKYSLDKKVQTTIQRFDSKLISMAKKEIENKNAMNKVVKIMF